MRVRLSKCLYDDIHHIHTQGSKWHFACAWGSVLKKLIAQFSSFQVPPPLKLSLREAYKVNANELMIHVLICI